MIKTWVKHISGQGEKWAVQRIVNDFYVVMKRTPKEDFFWWLPKSEYRPCEPPDPTWRDVTAECTVNMHGSIMHNGINTMVSQGYLRRKVQFYSDPSAATIGEGQWAFIIEKKVEALEQVKETR